MYPRQGAAVLSIWNQPIWNQRVNESLDGHDELRLTVPVRQMEAQRFLLFEDEISRFPADNCRRQVNDRGNLQGVETATGRHCFTWQPHGSQLTVIRQVPGAAVRFTINRAVPQVSPEHVMRLVRYNSDRSEIGQPPHNRQRGGGRLTPPGLRRIARGPTMAAV